MLRQIVDGPGVAIQAVGQVLGLPFGVLRGVKAYPLRTGAQGAIAETADAFTPADGGSWTLDDLAQFDRFPDSGTYQIEGERGTWNGKNRDTLALLNLDRGTEGTFAAAHPLGTPIYEVVDTHIYGFCVNPGSHRIRSVDAIYLNGIRKAASTPPTHVVNLDDQTILYDPNTDTMLSVVTVTFDMSTITAAQSEFIAPASLEAQRRYMANLARDLADFAAQREAARQAAIAQYGPITGAGAVGGTYWPGTPQRLVPVPQLGTVTGDLTGLQDDNVGTITGTPNSLLELPAHIVKLILREAYDQVGATFDPTSWDEAVAFQTAFGLRWAFYFAPMALGDFQRAVAQQSRTYVFLDPALGWVASFQRYRTPTATLSPDRRLAPFELRYTPIQDVIASLSVRFGQGDQERTINVSSPAADDLVQARSDELALPWVQDATTAEWLGRTELARRDHQRREATDVQWCSALDVVRTDGVAIESPLLDKAGPDQLPWRVVGTRVRPDGAIQIVVEEDDKTIEEQLGIAEVLGVSVNRKLILSETPALTEVLQRTVGKLLLETEAPSESLQHVTTLFAETLALTEALARQTGKVVAETLAPSEDLSPFHPAKSLVPTLGSVGSRREAMRPRPRWGWRT